MIVVCCILFYSVNQTEMAKKIGKRKRQREAKRQNINTILSIDSDIL